MPAKDLEAFLPALRINLPKGASLQGGALNTDLTITGPTNKIVTTGTVGLYNAKLVGFDLGSKMSAISMLTGVKTGKDLDIEKLTSHLHMAPDGIRADNFLAVVPRSANSSVPQIDSKNNLDSKWLATPRHCGGCSRGQRRAAQPPGNCHPDSIRRHVEIAGELFDVQIFAVLDAGEHRDSGHFEPRSKPTSFAL